MVETDPNGSGGDHGGGFLAWNPLGLAAAIVICATFILVTGLALFHSGEIGVMVHGLAFLVTGALVVGFIVYTATLSGDEH